MPIGLAQGFGSVQRGFAKDAPNSLHRNEWRTHQGEARIMEAGMPKALITAY